MQALGGLTPYYYVVPGAGPVVGPSVDAVLPRIPPGERRLNPAALLSMASFGWICGDITFVSGLRRVPWLGTLTPEGEIAFDEPPPYLGRRLTSAALAAEFVPRICEEVESALRGYRRVWLLLSGGLDSRVVLGVLRRLRDSGRLDCEVQTATWGRAGTRDVVYGQRLATMCGFEWHHIPLNSSSLGRNIGLAAELLGAEVSPVHLHGLPWFERASDGDAVLTASYGDSVGRAEFSGTHVLGLRTMRPKDTFCILRDEVTARYAPELWREARRVRERFGDRPEWRWREIEHQANYMRRLIAHAVSIVDHWAPTIQAFTSPDVYGLSWAVDPAYRTNEVWFHVLRLLGADLLQVPWARTGRGIDDPRAAPERIPARFDAYGLWLRRDHADWMEELIFRGGLGDLGVFDMKQVRKLFHVWAMERQERSTFLGQTLCWLASLEIFRRHYGILPPAEPFRRTRRAGARAKRAARAAAARARARLVGEGTRLESVVRLRRASKKLVPKTYSLLRKLVPRFARVSPRRAGDVPGRCQGDSEEPPSASRR